MADEASSMRARCQRCQKVYLVPREGRTYRCKSCGGEVALIDPSAVEQPQSDDAATSGERPSRVSRSPRPIAVRAYLVLGLISAYALADVAAVLAGLSRRSLLLHALERGGLTEQEAEASDLLYGMTALAQTGVLFLAAICWLFWMHRACANLRPLGGKHLRYSPGFAVGGWFIPFLNLWHPYKAMKEIWSASGIAAATAQGVERPRGPRTTLVTAWWLGWLLVNVCYTVAGHRQNLVSSLEEYVVATNWMTACDVLALVQTAFAFVVVQRITAWQRAAGA